MAIAQSQEEIDLEHQREWRRISIDFIHFLLTYVWILEPPPGRGDIRFEMWPHLKVAIKLLFTENKIIILKARQLGLTWLIAAYALWTVMTKKGARVLIISKGKDEAQKVIDRIMFIYKHLPEWMQLTLGTENKSEIEFKAMGSKIQALPSTEDAGRSETGTLVICDEHDFHPNAEANYAALKPTIDAVYSDGSSPQIICISTSNKLKMLSQFKKLYREAKKGNNGFKAVFFPWWARPARSMAWFNQQCKDFASEPWMREQEYPNTEDEALAPAKAIAAFNAEALTRMQSDCRKPVEHLDGELYSPVINVYKRYVPGRAYGGGADTGHGVGQDESVAVVIDLITMEVVADIQSSVLAPRDFARVATQMFWMYRGVIGSEPLVAVENNDWGHEVISYMQDEGYANFFYMDWFRLGKRDETRKKEIGWHTAPGGQDSGRWVIWGDLIDAVPGLVVYNEEGLKQFFTIIRNPEKNGKIEAIEGCHDDYPMACALAWHMRKYTWVGPLGNAGATQSYLKPTGRFAG